MCASYLQAAAEAEARASAARAVELQEAEEALARASAARAVELQEAAEAEARAGATRMTELQEAVEAEARAGAARAAELLADVPLYSYCPLRSFLAAMGHSGRSWSHGAKSNVPVDLHSALSLSCRIFAIPPCARHYTTQRALLVHDRIAVSRPCQRRQQRSHPIRTYRLRFRSVAVCRCRRNGMAKVTKAYS